MVAKFLDLNKLRCCKYVEGKKTNKMTCMTLLCMIALRNKTIVLFNRLTIQMAASLLRKTVEIQKFCYYGNVTSHFSSLFFKLITCLLKMVNHVIISRNCTWVVSSHRHPQPRPRAGLKPRGRNCLVPVKRRTQLPDE